MEMGKMDDSIPQGAAEDKNPKYPKGSYVKPLVGHMPNQKGRPAKVLKAVTGTFYILDFEDGKGPHKWYAEGELEADELSAEDRLKAAEEKARKGDFEDKARYARMRRSMSM